MYLFHKSSEKKKTKKYCNELIKWKEALTPQIKDKMCDLWESLPLCLDIFSFMESEEVNKTGSNFTHEHPYCKWEKVKIVHPELLWLQELLDIV